MSSPAPRAPRWHHRRTPPSVPSIPPLFQGFLVGFAIAAPVGPIGILCRQRALANGRLTGFLSHLRTASADMCYGAVAAFGIIALSAFLTSYQSWLRLLGSIFLVFLGLRAFFASPGVDSSELQDRRGLAGAYLSRLGLTLTNPATIISFTFIFAGLRLGQTGAGYLGAVLLVAEVFLGSAAWWLALSRLIGFFRDRFTPAWMRWVNRAAGVILWGFGFAAAAVSRHPPRDNLRRDNQGVCFLDVIS